jgi:regulator of replication initiation timing
MAVFETFKEAIGLIQKVDNIELYRQMLELQTQVFAVIEENHELRGENHALKEQLAQRQDLQFRENCYWTSAGDGPFCSRCYDVDKNLVRLHVREKQVPYCWACKTAAMPRKGREREENRPSAPKSPWV